MTTIYLIRHAEAEGNLYRRIHGQYDSLITDNGYRQIEALKERFAGVPIDAVYSSDLFRTMTTAKAVYGPKNLPLNTRADLRELDMGQWEDRTFASVAETDPERMKGFTTSAPEFRPPKGESLDEVRARGMAAILDIAAKHPGQAVAVFAHGTLIRNTLAGFWNVSSKDLKHSDNTAVTLLEVEGDQVKIVYSDDNSHLSEEISTLAQQHWWKGDSTKIDVNLWYQPFNLHKAEEKAFYETCREEAWLNLYEDLDRYDGKGFYADAKAAWAVDKGNLLKAMAGKTPVGILQLDPVRTAQSGKGYISFLYLLPKYRGSGLGIQLVGKAVSRYRRQGKDVLQLVCSEANQGALKFYKKYGFYETGTAPGAYGTLYQLEKYIGYGEKP